MRNSEDVVQITIEVPVTFDIPLEDLMEEWMEELTAEEILDAIKEDFKNPTNFIQEMNMLDFAEVFIDYKRTSAEW